MVHNSFNGNKSNGMFQANLGSMRSNSRRLSKTISCINNKKRYTYSDNSSTTHDNRGAFINRKFTKMGINSLKNSNTELNSNLLNNSCN